MLRVHLVVTVLDTFIITTVITLIVTPHPRKAAARVYAMDFQNSVVTLGSET
jgi:hypothetical protein